MKKALYVFPVLFLLYLAGCQNAADVASYNLSQAADNFKIERRIIFFDTWTDKYLLEIDGLCSIKSAAKTTGTAGVAVTCKTGPMSYKKHYLGLSGNVTYFSEQMQEASVSTYRYKVIFRPTVIVPDVDWMHYKQ